MEEDVDLGPASRTAQIIEEIVEVRSRELELRLRNRRLLPGDRRTGGRAEMQQLHARLGALRSALISNEHMVGESNPR
ncbi:MAG: hypothetical protein M1296_02520 [Chloroflexi bacterium]|nr:hypothetical protein [Chloroflexota bacterium]